MNRTLVLALSLLFPAIAPAADWPLFRGNALQNGIADARLPDQLEVRWTFKTKDSVEGAVAIADGVVYAGSYDGFLYAITLATGNEKWKVQLGPIKASPSVHNGRIYVGDADGKFYCVDTKGNRLWSFETQGEIAGGANFAGDHILIGSHDATLYCLDKDGKKVWDFKTEGPVNGSPAVIGDRTFVAGCDSSLHIIDVKTAKELAAIDLGGQAGATAAIRGDGLYVGTMNNEMLAISLKAQRIDWRFEAPKRKQPFYASAAVTDDLVIVGSRDKKVYALDRKTGEEKWSFLTENRVDSSPVVAGNRVFFGSLDKTFYVLDLKGNEVKRFDIDAGILGSPAVAEGCVVIGTEKGTVYCFGAKKE
jgi:eukaryotic-like serine/threonine-protein kinase